MILYSLGQGDGICVHPFVLPLSRVLARQYKAQLRRKSQQIQEALVRTVYLAFSIAASTILCVSFSPFQELDLRILEDLSKKVGTCLLGYTSVS